MIHLDGVDGLLLRGGLSCLWYTRWDQCVEGRPVERVAIQVDTEHDTNSDPQTERESICQVVERKLQVRFEVAATDNSPRRSKLQRKLQGPGGSTTLTLLVHRRPLLPLLCPSPLRTFRLVVWPALRYFGAPCLPARV